MSNLVSTEWLAAHLGDPHLVVLDATWHLPTAKRDAKAEFAATHIPMAQFFDLDKVSDQGTTLPHMLSTPERFALSMAALGISDESHVIAYDSYGLFSAPRCWWMFKIFGLKKVSVLDGGLKKWLAEKRATATGEPALAQAGNFRTSFNPAMLRNIEQVAATDAQIVDARSPTRFRGEEPEPRPGVRPGHIPGARNVHYAKFVTESGTLRASTESRQAFQAASVDITKPIITSCGSGVTAAILTLALTELGAKEHALYDGSWAEWGSSSHKIATGA